MKAIIVESNAIDESDRQKKKITSDRQKKKINREFPMQIEKKDQQIISNADWKRIKKAVVPRESRIWSAQRRKVAAEKWVYIYL